MRTELDFGRLSLLKHPHVNAFLTPSVEVPYMDRASFANALPTN